MMLSWPSGLVLRELGQMIELGLQLPPCSQPLMEGCLILLQVAGPHLSSGDDPATQGVPPEVR
jgi:hypothetical protein